MTRKLKGYSIVREDIIRERPNDPEDKGDILDAVQTIVATGKTKEGLLKHARLKKLDRDTHILYADYIEYINGVPVPDDEKIGHLNELLT